MFDNLWIFFNQKNSAIPTRIFFKKSGFFWIAREYVCKKNIGGKKMKNDIGILFLFACLFSFVASSSATTIDDRIDAMYREAIRHTTKEYAAKVVRSGTYFHPRFPWKYIGAFDLPPPGNPVTEFWVGCGDGRSRCVPTVKNTTTPSEECTARLMLGECHWAVVEKRGKCGRTAGMHTGFCPHDGSCIDWNSGECVASGKFERRNASVYDPCGPCNVEWDRYVVPYFIATNYEAVVQPTMMVVSETSVMGMLVVLVGAVVRVAFLFVATTAFYQKVLYNRLLVAVTTVTIFAGIPLRWLFPDFEFGLSLVSLVSDLGRIWVVDAVCRVGDPKAPSGAKKREDDAETWNAGGNKVSRKWIDSQADISARDAASRNCGVGQVRSNSKTIWCEVPTDDGNDNTNWATADENGCVACKT
jgi:hypothetical protein